MEIKLHQKPQRSTGRTSLVLEYYYGYTRDEEGRINSYELTLFIREEGDLYRKYKEQHFQRAYTLEEMKELLKRSGLTFLSAREGYTDREAGPGSERITIMARECGK